MRISATARTDGEGPGDPAVELLLTNTDGWEAREQLAEEVAAGLPPAPLWRQAEARMLAQRVSELVRDGHARPGEVVVLLRASGDLEVFERALQLRGLRTLAAVGAFWGHQQIGDLISYLRALANPLDEQALYGMLASPLGGCSRDCLALLAQTAQGTRRVPGRRRARRSPGTASWRPGSRPAIATRSRALASCCMASAPALRCGRSPCRSSARCRRRAIASTCSRWSGASGALPTCTSCCAWRGDSRPTKAAICAPFSTTSSISPTRRASSPTRRSRAWSPTPCA